MSPREPFPQRIVCLTEETTETLYLLGEDWRIVGISGFTVRPPRARKEKPRVSAFTSAKIDRILELEPDLVLGFSDLQAGIAAELVRAGLEVHVFNHRSVAEIFRMIRTLGGMIGCEAKTAASGRAAGGESGAVRTRAAAGLHAASARVFRGVGRAADLRHPLGIRADRAWPAGTTAFRSWPRSRLARNRIVADPSGGAAARARHHPRLVVRQEIPAGRGGGPAGLGRRSGGSDRVRAGDQVGVDPAARAGGTDGWRAGQADRGVGEWRGRWITLAAAELADARRDPQAISP